MSAETTADIFVSLYNSEANHDAYMTLEAAITDIQRTMQSMNRDEIQTALLRRDSGHIGPFVFNIETIPMQKTSITQTSIGQPTEPFAIAPMVYEHVKRKTAEFVA